MRKYVIMGVQGSGKGTQGKLLAADLDLVHIGVGDLFRWNVEHHTKIGAQVRRAVAAGALVEDELVEDVVRERLASHDWNYGFVIDGFPRNARQAEFFLETYDIDGVVVLEIPDEEVQRRVLARRVCSRCGEDQSIDGGGTGSETCGECGGRLVPRPDDQPEALAARLADYHEKTRPIIELFDRKEVVVHVDATQSVEAVQAEIRERRGLPEAGGAGTHVTQVRTHPAVVVSHGALAAEVDLELAPLIEEIWRAGIVTIHSCQDVGENVADLADRLPHLAEVVRRETGRASIGLPDGPALLSLLDALANAGPRDAFYERMVHWATPGAWQLVIAVRDPGLEAAGDTETGDTPRSQLVPASFQVRFPRADVEEMTERMRRHNRGDAVALGRPTWAAITVPDEDGRDGGGLF